MVDDIDIDGGDVVGGWVVHLPLSAVGRAEALRSAEVIASTLAALAPSRLRHLEATVSEEDDQCRQYPVFCARRLRGGSRCGRLDDHAGQCGADGGSPASADRL